MTTIVADRPCLLYATTRYVDAIKVLDVYRSPVCRTDGPAFRPVLDLLTETLHVEVYSDTYEDEDMFFGEATLTTFILFGPESPQTA